MIVSAASVRSEENRDVEFGLGGGYGAPCGLEHKPCTLCSARFSSSPNESFSLKVVSLHFVDSSGVVIGSEFTALAQKEARRGERE